MQRRRRERLYKGSSIFPSVLFRIYENSNVVSENARDTFWAACVCAFFSLLRCSNLFKQKDRTGRHLCVCDVTFAESGASLSVTILKPNSFYGGKFSVPSPTLGNKDALCPTEALRKMLRVTGVNGRDSLFSFRDKHGLSKALLPDEFHSLLHRAMDAAGIPSSHISTHSFRRGATTFASQHGVSPDAFMAQGHWRSSCVTRYIARDDDLRVAFSNAMASTSSRTMK